MALSERENFLRTARMQGPEWIPCRVHISGASWDQLREEAEEVCARHPILFPGFEKGKRDFDNTDFGAACRVGERYTDNWGCVWETPLNGIEGVVTESPLPDWDALATWAAPDATTTLDRSAVDWAAVRDGIIRASGAGELTTGGLAHGFLVLRLSYLRGFENLMLDLATGEPRLEELIETVVDHNEIIVRNYLDIGVDIMGFPEDLGTQTASIVSPATFYKWFTPQYARLMDPCREAGVLVHLHSDGYVMDLIDDFLTAGVDIVNPQDLCNGIDALAEHVKGRTCIDLDIDRQTIVPFGTRAEIRDLIEEEVRKLGSPAGGLAMICGIYPPTSAENLDALCFAMEEFRTFWWDGRG